MIIILSGPSGAGEDSIIAGLQKTMPIKRIVTTTTRTMRPGESQGKPYHFVSQDQFQADLSADAFFEHAKQDNEQLYGVKKSDIKEAQESSDIFIWKVDYQGVQNAKTLLPQVKSILISAPLHQLEKRIRGRGGMSEERIKERIQYAQGWLQNKHLFDYVIDNRDGQLKKSIQKVADIINTLTEKQH